MKYSYPLVAALLLSPIVAQTITVRNDADLARNIWVDVALPFSRDYPESWVTTERRWLVIRGRSVGVHSTIAHVRCTELAPSEVVVSDLEELKAGSSLPPFQTSEWLTVGELMPVVSVDALQLSPRGVQLVEQNTGRQVWRVGYVLAGFHADVWIYVYSAQEVCRFEAQIAWSDRTSPGFRIDVERVRFQFGTDVHSEFAEGEGWSTAGQAVTWRPPGGRMGDAEIVPFRGLLLPHPPPSPDHESADLDELVDREDAHATAQRDISAALRGRASAVSHDWAGRWLALGSIPEVPIAPGAESLEPWAVPGTMYGNDPRRPGPAPRPLESELRASNAGAQASFGIAKAGPAVSGHDPRHLAALEWSVAGDALRPVHQFEANGAPVRWARHPDWSTWGRRHHLTGTDFLGKPSSGPNYGVSGRNGHNDTHLASVLDEYLALSGSYQAEEWLVNLVLGPDLAQARIRQGSLGRARATGRVLHWFANAALLIDQRHRRAIEGAILRRLEGITRGWPGARTLQLFPDRPFVLIYRDDGDPRGIIDPHGDPAPFVSPWEHSRAAAGLLAASNVLRGRNQRASDLARNYAYLAGRAVVLCAYQEPSGWNVPYQAYAATGDDDGRAPDLAVAWQTKKAAHRGWLTWSYAGIAVFDRLGRELPFASDAPLRAKAKSILRWTADAYPPQTWIDSEWRAIR